MNKVTLRSYCSVSIVCCSTNPCTVKAVQYNFLVCITYHITKDKTRNSYFRIALLNSQHFRAKPILLRFQAFSYGICSFKARSFGPKLCFIRADFSCVLLVYISKHGDGRTSSLWVLGILFWFQEDCRHSFTLTSDQTSESNHVTTTRTMTMKVGIELGCDA